ncbi:NADH dehydrogenase [ubiquinone] flavoprotein 1, mitochondrial [Drosophila novamexicana]|uniref:NADH dehydrogenase [ubiquinone] flavoprotein 1, mitochondrial n=1 Tax=Drosophila novamexicana TaxID=47314 RepID=UPI0011E604EF|nr:NADH dehydrogenase [ubiquinone] flavoprotein 1, mitochondrial [Drosophila novamexicana]
MLTQFLPQKGLLLLRRWQLGNSPLLQPNKDYAEMRKISQDVGMLSKNKAAATPAPAKACEQKAPVPPPAGMLSNTKTDFGPLTDCDRIFQNLYGRLDWRLKGACARGDWYRTADLLEMGPQWIMDEVKRSGLRGRGGSGYYAGSKWEQLQKVESKDKILILNCAEGEPGTCKDREILRHEPHKIIEGCLLAGFAMGCEKCIIYVRNRFYNEACNLQFALAEAYRYGLIGCNSCDTGIKFEIHVQRGDRYLTGEETALVNCLMGKLARPRKRPPYLHEKGYFDHPSTVINTESLAVVPTILRRGAKWFTSLGRNMNFGTKLFNISGHVLHPCTVEEEMSMPLRDIIEMHAGGVCGGWNNLLAVWPGGLSTPLLGRAAAEEVLMDYDALEAKGSELGTGGIIVVCNDCDPLLVMQHTIEFYMKQTCKQCTPCRDGAIWLPEIFKNFTRGESVPHMMDFIEVISKTMTGTTICALSDSQANVARGLIQHFAPYIEERILEYINDDGSS